MLEKVEKLLREPSQRVTNFKGVKIPFSANRDKKLFVLIFLNFTSGFMQLSFSK